MNDGFDFETTPSRRRFNFWGTLAGLAAGVTGAFITSPMAEHVLNQEVPVLSSPVGKIALIGFGGLLGNEYGRRR